VILRSGIRTSRHAFAPALASGGRAGRTVTVLRRTCVSKSYNKFFQALTHRERGG